MSDLDEKLNRLLSNPEELQKLMSMASAFLGGMAGEKKDGQAGAASAETTSASPEWPAGSDAPGAEQSASSFASESRPSMNEVLLFLLKATEKMGEPMNEGIRNKLNLLAALKPFLGEPHRTNVDRAVSLVKTAQVARAALGRYGGGENKNV